MESARSRWVVGLVAAAALILLALAATGAVLERNEGTPLVRVGQGAPNFTLPASTGGTVTMAEQRGHPVLLAFVPSVQCHACQLQLRTLQALQPTLASRGIDLYVVSTDEPVVQRIIARSLHLTYPFLAEEVVIGRHPAGHAYGIYHLAGPQQGPVDANALVLIDAAGVVRAIDRRPAGQQSLATMTQWLDQLGGGA